jgi:hypothetical protein
MILRRVIIHFRNQEWTAIALDFLIVVIGVVVGIQVSNWNTERINDARALGYFERIGDNLDADMLDTKQRMAFWQQVADYGALGLSYAETGEAGAHSKWDLVLAYFQSSQVAELIPYQSTYDELKSAGELGLISNFELRNELAVYYVFTASPTVTERPPYRQHVRGLIPIDVQIYIWDSCYSTNNTDDQEMHPCPSPVDEARATQIVARISNDEALMTELRYWMSTMHVAGIIGRDRMKSALALRAMVDEEILNQ